MKQAHDKRRRTLLGWLAGTAVASTASPAWAAAGGNHIARVGDAAMALEFDGQLRCRVLSKHAPRPGAVTGFAPSERLRLKDGRWIERFALTAQAADRVDGPHGSGVRHRFTGVSAEGVEKTVAVTFHDRHPGFAIVRVAYRNTGAAPLAVTAWANSGHTLRPAAGRKPEFWTFSGASHLDRRDWVQPVKAGFDQRNFMGMNASDYGGGTPAADVWQRDCGLAVGHIDTVPRLVALPVRAVKGGAAIGVEYELEATLAPGESLATLDTFLAVSYTHLTLPTKRIV